MTKSTELPSGTQDQPPWTDPDLPPDQFLYERKGPWPQPAPAYPMTRPAEVLNIPEKESLEWWEYIGSRLGATYEVEKFLAPGQAQRNLDPFKGLIVLFEQTVPASLPF